MAEAQLKAFDHGVDQLIKALAADSEEAGRGAVIGLARLVFFELDRIADALEKIALTRSP